MSVLLKFTTKQREDRLKEFQAGKQLYLDGGKCSTKKSLLFQDGFYSMIRSKWLTFNSK
jgi:hypothetical protein